jgi:predicted nucleotidyltransferase
MLGDIERVLEALNSAGVRYLVVGGVAVVLHGHLRTTADLDLVVQLERDNVLRAMGALASLGYRPRAPVAAEAFADEEVRESWVRDKGLTVFSLWSSHAPTLEVDLFVREPFGFADVYARALRAPLENTVAWVVSLPDLIALKTQARRPQDLEDIEALEALEAGDVGEGEE